MHSVCINSDELQLIVQDCITSIEEQQLPVFEMYPNPVTEVLNLTFEKQMAEGSILEVFTPLGQVVYRINIENQSNLQVQQSEIGRGVRFVRVLDGATQKWSIPAQLLAQ